MEDIEKKLDTIVAYLYMIKERIDEILQERDDALSPIPILETDLVHFMETDD